MKITLTGSTGHISKPLAETLVQQGHQVTIISSNPEKQKEIEALEAKAAIGSLYDVDFLTAAFTGADAVYCMEPPVNFFDPNVDVMEYTEKLANNYSRAIRNSGVTRVVHLSSIGAHTNVGNGMLAFHYNVENILKQLPAEIAITFMRPVGFYYNLLGFIPGIKKNGTITTNYNAAYKEPWVSPLDIADAIAEEIVKDFKGRTVRYIASEELTSDEIAAILGAAIGKPDLKWIAISDEQQLNQMLAFGMNPKSAKGLVEMNAARQTGVLFEDYLRHKPVLGKVKLVDFAKEFAAVYNKN